MYSESLHVLLTFIGVSSFLYSNRMCICVCVLICIFPKFAKMAMSIKLKFSEFFYHYSHMGHFCLILYSCMNNDIKIIIAFGTYEKSLYKSNRISVSESVCLFACLFPNSSETANPIPSVLKSDSEQILDWITNMRSRFPQICYPFRQISGQFGLAD